MFKQRYATRCNGGDGVCEIAEGDAPLLLDSDRESSGGQAHDPELSSERSALKRVLRPTISLVRASPASHNAPVPLTYGK